MATGTAKVSLGLIAWILLFLVGCATDRAEGPPVEKGGEGRDPWAIKRPPSNPRGKPLSLAFNLGGDKVHRYRITMENTVIRPDLMSTRAEYDLRIEPGRSREGNTAFRAPFQVLTMLERGQDVLHRVPPAQRRGEASGLIDAAGRLDRETFRVGGATERVNRRIRARLAALLLLFPAGPVRPGEVWEVPLDRLRSIIGGPGSGGSFTGEACQVFEGMEKREGRECARIRFLFSLCKSGPALAELGGAAGELRGKGAITYWYALEGYVQEAQGRTVSRIEAHSPAGGRMVSRQNGELVIKGELAAGGGGAGAAFKVRFETTKGSFVAAFHPANAPLGVKRLRELVAAGFYDGCAFFRVMKGFVAQFGINGDPALHRRWLDRRIKDDPVRLANLAGTIAFATEGPGTRTTHLFINLGNNLRLGDMGFAPLGRVVSGMEVVRSLYSGYGDARSRGGKGPEQELIEERGNRYLREKFPRLDYIKRARIIE